MNKQATYMHSDAKAIEALALMKGRGRHFLTLPVLEVSPKKVVGIGHLHDLVGKGTTARCTIQRRPSD